MGVLGEHFPEMAFGFFDCFMRVPDTWSLLKNLIGEGVMREVLVNAYPKSGVTWLVHLVCDLLEGFHKDNDSMQPLTYDHPVTSDWIIRKIHYPYWSQAIPHVKGKLVILTQRDPRDIVVSAMFYRRAPDLDKAIDVMVQSNYVDYLESWLNPVEPLKVKKLIITRYEHLHVHPTRKLGEIIAELIGERPVAERIREAIERQSFPNMVKQLGGDRHFMRKGIVGDWRSHFNREQAKRFNIHFGEFMLGQGYVDNLEWWKDV